MKPRSMHIKQWEDTNLAQFSYGILSYCERKIVLIDPARNPRQYLDYAKENNAEITAVIETHPHADFISSHLELSEFTGATIYISSLIDAGYPYTAFDNGNSIELGNIKLTSIFTPGHSPDSISVLLEYDGKQKAIFTGDTLFIGDCGRPDLREVAGKLRGTTLELAKSMYHSLTEIIMTLDDDVTLYPGHGAGTLCGKGLSKSNSSTIGQEKQTNWSLQVMPENEFVGTLLSDQPFIPAYFPYDVELNRNGAPAFKESIALVTIGDAIKTEHDSNRLSKQIMIVDTRREKQYKKGHLPQSVNLMDGPKFETWLGSIIKPGEPFYLTAETTGQLQSLIERTAAIGYEPQIKEAFVLESGALSEPLIDIETFRQQIDDYTIIDVRNGSEVKDGRIFKNSLSIPLTEVRNRVLEIPANKPLVVHCAGGYRSAAGSSIIKSALNGKVKVFDLGEAVKLFITK